MCVCVACSRGALRLRRAARRADSSLQLASAAFLPAFLPACLPVFSHGSVAACCTPSAQLAAHIITATRACCACAVPSMQVPNATLSLGINITQPLMQQTGQIRWALNNVAGQFPTPCESLLDLVYR